MPVGIHVSIDSMSQVIGGQVVEVHFLQGLIVLQHCREVQAVEDVAGCGEV